MVEIKSTKTESSLKSISADESHNIQSITRHSSPITDKRIWYVYLLECQDGSFYTGVTNDLDKRMKAHSEGKGSKYVRRKKFKQLLISKQCKSRSDAQKAECHIKTLQKYDKLDWFK